MYLSYYSELRQARDAHPCIIIKWYKDRWLLATPKVFKSFEEAASYIRLHPSKWKQEVLLMPHGPPRDSLEKITEDDIPF